MLNMVMAQEEMEDSPPNSKEMYEKGVVQGRVKKEEKQDAGTVKDRVNKKSKGKKADMMNIRVKKEDKQDAGTVKDRVNE
jgi:hypothetical protein